MGIIKQVKLVQTQENSIDKVAIQEKYDKINERKENKKIKQNKLEKYLGLDYFSNLFFDVDDSKFSDSKLFKILMVRQDLFLILLMKDFYDFSNINGENNSKDYNFSKTSMKYFCAL